MKDIKEFKSISILLSTVKNNRQIYLGIAIVLVILYHMWCRTPIFALIPFQKGSIGVDIFLFLSGYGLSHSYTKNPTVRFYYNRIYRIYPIFIVFAIFRSLMYLYDGDSLSIWDWICNLTTLSYYQIGGRIFDWYIAAIIILYLSFPLLYRIAKWEIIIGLAFLVTIIFWIYGRPFFIYECLLARIPIFMAGILAYRDPRHLLFVIIGFVLCSPFAILGVKSSPLGTCMLCLILLVAISIIVYKNLLPTPINKFFSFCGNYSLELYLGNGAALTIHYPSFINNDYSNAFCQLILTFICGGILVLINSGIKIIINKYKYRNCLK